MRSAVAPFLLVVLVIALPFSLRSRVDAADDAGDPVVVVTPHNDVIRYEFGHAFREYMRERGRSVHVEWRAPGGTGEVFRMISRPGVHDIDVVFGGGSANFVDLAAKKRLADSGILRRHPELFGPEAIPQSMAGSPYWDAEGRWVGAALSTFGICYNSDSLSRLSIPSAPSQWTDLADPRYLDQLALADPSRAGSAQKAFEMIVQQQIHAVVAERGALGTPGEPAAVGEGWSRAMRLIRKISANARYFTDGASKIPLDVATGNAAAGMCIDFYGRFQSESFGPSAAARLAFVAPRGGTTIDADPIGVLASAPHPALSAEFVDFVLSREGQALWDFKVGVPLGPRRYALRRLPISRSLYDAQYESSRSDPAARPYTDGSALEYRPSWTGRLLPALTLLIDAMCVDSHDELTRAYRALVAGRFPPQATALFDDVSSVAYARAAGQVQPLLASGNTLGVLRLESELVTEFRDQYARVAELASEGR